METWLDALPRDSTPMEQLTLMAQRGGCILQRVGGKAGDLVLWSDTMPHGSTTNTGDAPRMVQYITMVPAAADQNPNSRSEPVRGTFRSDRIKLWESHLAAAAAHGPPSRPTVLGPVARRIIGVEPWGGDRREGFSGSAAEWRVDVSGQIKATVVAARL